MTNPLATDLDFILERTEDLWSELRNERIFITGGTGFFGSWLLESFAFANKRLNLKSSALVLSRNPDIFAQKANHLFSDQSIEFLRGNIIDFTFPKGHFSHIIHAATEASAKLASEKPELMYATITKGTKRVLEFGDICRTKKVLFTSSGAVYGKQPPELNHISEDYITPHAHQDEKAIYGQGKVDAEKLCLQATSTKLEIKIARCFAFVGPHLPLDTHFAIGNFLLAGLQNKPILIKGDGTPYRSYLYASELMIWLWKILFCGNSGRPYNVGSENEINIADLACKVAQHFDPQLKVEILQKSTPKKAADRYVPSTKRARDELGLQQEIDLEKAIEKTKLWHLFQIDKH